MANGVVVGGGACATALDINNGVCRAAFPVCLRCHLPGKGKDCQYSVVEWAFGAWA